MAAKKGELNHNWTGGKSLEIECKICGKLFKVYPSHSHFKYCSKSCCYKDPERCKDIRKRKKGHTTKSQRADEILDEILAGVSDARHNQLLDEYNNL